MISAVLTVAAQATQPSQGPGPGFHLLVMIGGCFAIIYFMVMRPQKQREKRRKELLGLVIERCNGLSQNLAMAVFYRLFTAFVFL